MGDGQGPADLSLMHDSRTSPVVAKVCEELQCKLSLAVFKVRLLKLESGNP